MSDFLLEDFMLPMGLRVKDLSEGTGIPLEDITAMLADALEVKPKLSEKPRTYFGVSDMLFYDIQQDLKTHAGVRKIAYARLCWLSLRSLFCCYMRVRNSKSSALEVK